MNRVVKRGGSRSGRPPQQATAARDAVTRLSSHVATRGLRHSRQRDIVTEAFYELEGHVSVEAVLERAREKDPRVGVATVYRTMKLLGECGLAVARRFGDGATLYERGVDQGHHDHLICRRCGCIVEFENDQIESLQEQVARRHGFEVESHKLELYGRCAACHAGARVRRSA